MKTLPRHGVALLAAVLVIGAVAGRNKGAPDERRAARPPAAPPALGLGPGREVGPRAAPDEGRRPAPEVRPVPAPEPAARGAFRISGGASGADGLRALELTSSQDTIVRSLLAGRDLRLEELRRNLEDQSHGPGKAPLAEYSAQTRRTQEEFLDSVRAILLPAQKERLEALLRGGHWGGYSLVVAREADSDP